MANPQAIFNLLIKIVFAINDLRRDFVVQIEDPVQFAGSGRGHERPDWEHACYFAASRYFATAARSLAG